MDLFTQPTQVKINLEEDHELVRIEKIINWDELIELAMNIRLSRIKAQTGPEPHYRELLGAVVLMAVKNITYREAEDLIAHYAPARYLCNLMESNWRIDHSTIFEFMKMMGGAGMEKINSQITDIAVREGFADPKELMSDTTAQEAKIPYPNEVGLMSKYLNKVKNLIKRTGRKFSKAKTKIKEVMKEAKGLVRTSHLFAKGKEQKRKVTKKLLHIVDDIHGLIQDELQSGRELTSKAGIELTNLTQIMDTLVTQIFYFTETGCVAAGKIIHLQMHQLYSIVRGKAGKKVEFGLKWGINRLKGGFITGFLMNGGKHLSDKKFSIEAINYHINQFGTAPETFGFDRGGYSKANIKKAKKLGVKHVGIAPTGQSEWAVSKTKKKHITRERAQVEGLIGTVKSPLYGFNKPNARSIQAMESCGQRSFLGFNLKKLVREKMNLELQAA